MFRKGDKEYQFQKRNFELIAYLDSKGILDDTILNFFIESETDFYKITKENNDLKNRLCRDEKTGLLTYKITHFENTLLNYYDKNTNNESVSVSLIRFDLDNFSSLNSGYGHKFGDDVLNRFADILVSSSRPDDLLIRYGGEEFDVFLIDHDETGAINFAKRVINITSNTLFQHNRKPVKVTVSAGISSETIMLKNYVEKTGMINSLNELLQVQADHALYESKYNGKDQYSIFLIDKKEYYEEIRKNYKRSMIAVNE